MGIKFIDAETELIIDIEYEVSCSEILVILTDDAMLYVEQNNQFFNAFSFICYDWINQLSLYYDY